MTAALDNLATPAERPLARRFRLADPSMILWIAMIYPPDGSVLIIAPSGIPKGVKHPNAAKLFMEYLLTPEASKIWVEHFNESMRPEVKPLNGAKSAADVKTIHPTVEEITKGIPEAIKQWRDTFGV